MALTDALTSENVLDLFIRCEFTHLDLGCRRQRKEKPFRSSPDCSIWQIGRFPISGKLPLELPWHLPRDHPAVTRQIRWESPRLLLSCPGG